MELERNPSPSRHLRKLVGVLLEVESGCDFDAQGKRSLKIAKTRPVFGSWNIRRH
jgi:hypothetical protein